ncbi:hypothetical protein Cantr_05639 [Candida viswanathii]|uniref:Pet127p n=1 Tax=Candida viswanathii TaxID=5486 RepID=A0A367XS22_9ASCO|nr:hypothetical protein Cantr_05639 [Candida viswanathii]
MLTRISFQQKIRLCFLSQARCWSLAPHVPGSSQLHTGKVSDQVRYYALSALHVENTKRKQRRRKQKKKKMMMTKEDKPVVPETILERVDMVMDRTDELPRRKVEKRKEVYFHTSASNITDKVIEQSIAPKKEDIAQLAHNLDRVLFSPGVHFLQDPRTRIYNFSPFLKKVISYEDFNFELIPGFTPASKHSILLENARNLKKQFYSSTSAMTHMLSKFYALLNNCSTLSRPRVGNISFDGLSFHLPASLIVQPRGEFYDEATKTTKPIYSILSDKSCDSEMILSAMGNCLEVLLTNPEDEFVKYRRDHDGNTPKQIPTTYNYASYGGFLMRSQLDCYDERLPGNGTFDLKTRATANIRYSSADVSKAHSDYQIWKLKGNYESYEKEYRDLIRTGAMMKYMFQARIGQMDGIFLAYHNINSIFGFEYLPLEELDKIFYSSRNSDLHLFSNVDEVDLDTLTDNLPSLIGESQFKISMEMWETLMTDHILKDLNKGSKDMHKSFRLIVEQSHSWKFPVALTVSVVPVTKEDVDTLEGLSERFPSSFKLKLTPEQRLENLANHAKELKEFNQRTIDTKNTLQYKIRMRRASIDGRDTFPSVLPSTKFKDWKVTYTITKKKTDTKRVIQLLDLGIRALTSELRESKVSAFRRKMDMIHTAYEKIGSIRKKAWEAKEGKPVVYEPKYKF